MPRDLFDWADTMKAAPQPPLPVQSSRSHRSATNYRRGTSAEAAAERAYSRRGIPVAARRWRGASGEIDLILRDGPRLIFAEVKAARTFDAALARIRPRQIARILSAAQEYLGGEPTGSLTEMRFDAVLVDALGDVRIVEGAFDQDG